ncbi:Na(+)-translocating NADH-quinone reductase subunit C [Methylophaga frappieri]|uniref:Na(+)-translocating NADH-quinone reductase subunit C n=1 Tax=Methylophaga frappieri (strain ATCC BAA-2434 / DSM 25690 / JAM7) TaxID=754477 RepID=I1YIW1_METFJ|nr:Na(+)-translocating NADH-quinone reductase subunit C [Methylophaga frappieri]AFJ02854.1 Na(+)-translocating NADH-quinone reductase subunit C [Methylophaga frappieri]
MALPNDDPRKTILIAVLLCLVCSVLVSTAAVALKSQQTANKKNDIRQNILAVTGLYEPGMDVNAAFEQFEAKLVDLSAGEFAETDLDPLSFDQYKAAGTAEYGVDIENDIAGIGNRAQYATVYLLRDPETQAVQQVVLPVHGYGLWSTMYGFLSLQPDLNTIAGLRFYQHAETPGLGGEIDNPRWRAKWEGKQIYDENGNVALRVVRGFVDENAQNAEYKVDGLSGATLTSQGVSNMMVYWLGDNGFGPFLKNLRTELESN